MLQQIVQIATGAGVKTLEFYGQGGQVTFKTDQSPLTQADLASDTIICEQLQRLTPEIPIVSEERHLDPATAGAERFWLVDPLDGTKEFTKQTGEFTVNIALIEKGVATLGVVYAPVLKLCYFAGKNSGAWRQEHEQPAQPIKVRAADPARLAVVASKDHAGPLVAEFLSKIPEATLSSMGSSLKFCLVAEGKADLYPRLSPTMEWDTGAAQCVVEMAGGGVLNPAGRPLLYGKSGHKNAEIITVGDLSLAWRDYLPSSLLE
jgi:3'(2'), 5'-bisphosphate nucleotidase